MIQVSTISPLKAMHFNLMKQLRQIKMGMIAFLKILLI